MEAVSAESKVPGPRQNSSPTKVWVVLSLAINVALAIWLVRHPSSSPAAVPSRAVRSATTDATPSASALAPAETAIAETNSATPFHWSQIESTDYRQYIANLRAAGFPEEIIRDLIN